ncbi:unnamed protein product [Prunus armeniaca]|uniref:Uncharacterized protein n=1 Tax=Prunus armeniaca TaxID=36596 RepID=A0A6J5THU2_PRUAR|nr:unnamed protein product [Prunus armeniaca]CAB4293906.1 unnamed protein product [Prunus armeniaca]
MNVHPMISSTLFLILGTLASFLPIILPTAVIPLKPGERLMKVEKSSGPKIVFFLSSEKEKGVRILTLSIAHVKALKQGSQDSQNQKESLKEEESLTPPPRSKATPAVLIAASKGVGRERSINDLKTTLPTHHLALMKEDIREQPLDSD